MQVYRKRQVVSEQTSNISSFLNALRVLKCVLNCGQRYPYFDPDYPTSGLAVMYCNVHLACRSVYFRDPNGRCGQMKCCSPQTGCWTQNWNSASLYRWVSAELALEVSFCWVGSAGEFLLSWLCRWVSAELALLAHGKLQGAGRVASFRGVQLFSKTTCH
jgi:hypothetical protein